MGSVTVLRNHYIKGYGGGSLEKTEMSPTVPLLDALSATYDDDAALCCYHLEDKEGNTLEHCPRLNKGPWLDEGGWSEDLGAFVRFDAVVLDVDGPDHAAPDDWREEQKERFDNLPSSDVLGWYDTRGGYRLVWSLAESVSPSDFNALVRGLRVEANKVGIYTDAEAEGWNHCYRLPFVVRDGERLQFDSDLSWLEDGHLEDVSSIVAAAPSSMFSGIDRVQAPLSIEEKITEARNVTLTRLAGKLRRSGMNENEISSALVTVNQGRCDPPLPDEEVVQIARSVCRYDPAPKAEKEGTDDTDEETPAFDGPRFTLGSEVEIAQHVGDEMERLGTSMIYDRSTLWAYKDKRGLWEIVHEEALHQITVSYDGEMVMGGRDRNGNPKLMPLKVSNVLTESVAKLIYKQRVHRGWLDGSVDGILFRNHFIRVDGEGIHKEEFDPEHRQTTGLPFEFIENAKPVKFLQMLRDCWRDEPDVEDRIQLLREWVGAALCNRAPLYAKGLILVGGGANGKSTIQSIVTALFPVDSVTAVAPQDFDNEYRRAMLSNTRLNVVAELPEADILASEAVKAMISGDQVVAREIRQSPFAYYPKAAHLFSANSLPGVRDMSKGFWRRWCVLDFKREFAEHEQDRHLAKRIVCEELSRIASWAIQGCYELAVRGHYTTPLSSDKAVKEWRRAADQIAGFVDARCGEYDDVGVTATQLYNTYIQWATSTGHRQMSQVNFGKRLAGLGVEKKRGKNGFIYKTSLKPHLSAVAAGGE